MFNFFYGIIEVGKLVDLIIIDFEIEKVINSEEFVLKGKNMLFVNWVCKGWLVMILVEGKWVWEDVKVCNVN